MINRYDVVIIGGGIAGASLGAELAAQASVLILEQEKNPGMHSTGRSAAYYAPSYGNDVVRQLTRNSDDYYRRTDHEVPLIHDRDALFIGTQSQTSSLDAMAQDQPELRRLSAAETCHIVPALKSEVIAAGLLDTVGGDLDVDAILQGYLRTFKQQGGEMKTSAQVRELDHSGGMWRVRGSELDVEAPIVINASGAWADTIAGLANLAPLGLVPKRRTAVLVDGDEDWNHWPLTIDIDEGFYFKPDAGQLLISPADETPSEPCDAQPEEFDIAVAIDRVQKVANIPVKRINHKWAGLRTFAPDKSFVIGFDPRTTGFFWCAGQGGYGVQSAPGVASLASQLCLEQTTNRHPDLLLEQVAPDRLL